MATCAIREKGKDTQEEGTVRENILRLPTFDYLLVQYFFLPNKRRGKSKGPFIKG